MQSIVKSVWIPLLVSMTTGFGVASATETHWAVASGNWSTPENWDNGEPTADCAATVADGNATINEAGEVCASLHVGPESGTLATLQMNTGTLTVAGTVTASRGIISHFSGTAVYGRLELGGSATGSYAQGAGSLTVGTLVAGSATKTGAFSISSGTFTVNDSTVINRFGSLVLNGFQTTSTLGHVVAHGGFSVANGGAPITAESLIMDASTRVLAGMGPGGISRVDVAGPAVLGGSIQIQDVNNIFDGTFEFIRAENLSGSFTTENLPERWSWYVEGNSLFLRKGDPSPVQGTSWGRIKATRD